MIYTTQGSRRRQNGHDSPAKGFPAGPSTQALHRTLAWVTAERDDAVKRVYLWDLLLGGEAIWLEDI